MGKLYESVLTNSELLRPQYEPEGYYYTYYTFSARFEGAKFKVSWEQFREKYIENGGDGIYAASKLLFQEPIFKEKNIGFGDTPTAVKLQKSLMNFTTNQSNKEDQNIQRDALIATLKYFGDST
tara:strand:- start:958 stop:1329 length:372 start_codon:yes stop_codon:yes gene_type:complete